MWDIFDQCYLHLKMTIANLSQFAIWNHLITYVQFFVLPAVWRDATVCVQSNQDKKTKNNSGIRVTAVGYMRKSKLWYAMSVTDNILACRLGEWCSERQREREERAIGCVACLSCPRLLATPWGCRSGRWADPQSRVRLTVCLNITDYSEWGTVSTLSKWESSPIQCQQSTPTLATVWLEHWRSLCWPQLGNMQHTCNWNRIHNNIIKI